MYTEPMKHMNFAQVLEMRGAEPTSGKRIFMMYRDDDENIHSITYAEFYRTSLLYGNMLRQMRDNKGVKPTERFHVGVYMQNTPEFLYLLGGCAFASGVLVGINNAQIGERLAVDINRMAVDVLFVDDAIHKNGGTFLEKVLEAREKYVFDKVDERDIVVVSDKHSKLPHGISTIGAKVDEYAEKASSFQPYGFNEDATGLIIFTSGTTGAPKGIEVSWKKLVDVGINATRILNYTENDVGYVCMPLNHSNSVYLNIMPALLNGARIGLRRKFSATRFVKDLEDYRATVWNCVGDPVQYVLNVVGDRDHSHLPLRIVISTGTPPDNRDRFSGIFGLTEFKEVYGSTESGAITQITQDSPRYTVGRLLKDIKVVAEDDPDRECALAMVAENDRIVNFENAVGEIVVSQSSLGDSKFTGYYKMPEENMKRIDHNNCFHMGDLGAIVEGIGGAKYLIFLGRTGDWIRCKGENWVAIDVENIIARYEGISLAAVIGIPQSTGREDDAMYIIETAEPEEFDVKVFYEYCAKELPHYTLPRFIRVVRSLPQTDTLKTQRELLRREHFTRSPEKDATNEDLLFELTDGELRRFTAVDYYKELAKYRDPTARDRLVVSTRNPRIFQEVSREVKR